ncbi:MAG: GAF domain-containing protein, partial [Candidatus Rokuibacteriota bacterium]
EVDYPLICTVTDPDTGLERHFRVFFDWRFEDVVATDGVPPLSDEVRQRLHANLLDPVWLREVLPPEQFVIRGFTIFRAMEVTDQEVLSALKRDLIDRESIVSQARFAELQSRLRTLFRRPEVRLSLAALDGERVLILNSGARIEHACIFADSVHHRMEEFAGTVYDRAVTSGRPLIVDDLATLEGRTAIEDQMVASGIRAFLCAPLHYQDRVIGTLDLDSPRPGDLDASLLPKLHEVLPLFSMAVQRSMEELNARIQTQIKERFTAIHPAVEWRFRKAVLDALEYPGPSPGASELEPIVFENVYPLYALSDIRSSSTQRALAIQGDLLAQLGLARDVVEAAMAARPLPALDELRYRID